jgi:hypothetical protein
MRCTFIHDQLVLYARSIERSRRSQVPAVHAYELIGPDSAGRKTYPIATVDDKVAGPTH